LLGHAFGNLLARMVTTDHPDMVKAVILAAAQGSEVPEDIGKTPFIVGDTFAPEADRIAALRKAFFAPNHDATIWLDGWYPATLKTQRSALKAVSLSDYWTCGHVPLLELISAYDPFKPEPYWHELRNQFPDRVTSVVIDDASHALFPEQSDMVAHAVLAWLTCYPRRWLALLWGHDRVHAAIAICMTTRQYAQRLASTRTSSARIPCDAPKRPSFTVEPATYVPCSCCWGIRRSRAPSGISALKSMMLSP
jgi:hypothetical protein